MKVVCGTPWTEVEFGQRPEGWKIFINPDEALRVSNEDSAKGTYDGGYYGPVRPVIIYEIPLDCLTQEMKESLKKNGRCFSPNNWEPKFFSRM